jgi:hypothetical protein
VRNEFPPTGEFISACHDPYLIGMQVQRCRHTNGLGRHRIDRAGRRISGLHRQEYEAPDQSGAPSRNEAWSHRWWDARRSLPPSRGRDAPGSLHALFELFCLTLLIVRRAMQRDLLPK